MGNLPVVQLFKIGSQVILQWMNAEKNRNLEQFDNWDFILLLGFTEGEIMTEYLFVGVETKEADD